MFAALFENLKNLLNNNQGILALIGIIISLIGSFAVYRRRHRSKNNGQTIISKGKQSSNLRVGRDMIVKTNINKRENKKEDQLKIDIHEKKVSWAKYGISRWIFPSFRVVLSINNFHNDSPEYVRAHLQANSNDGKWKTIYYVFLNPKEEDKSKPDQEYRIERKYKEIVALHLSNFEVGCNENKPMPDFDRDTLKLILETESGKRIVRKIKPAWIVSG